MAWSVAPYAEADREAVAALILGIQRDEFGLPLTLADQPDLLDIPRFYVKGRNGHPGGFWVARETTPEGGRVVGTIALLNIGPDVAGNGRAALRKMFVAADFRGAGVAAALLDTLLGWSAHNTIREIFLGTTTRYLAAHRFYEKHGFARLDKTELPASFPVMAVDTVFYAKRLPSA